MSSKTTNSSNSNSNSDINSTTSSSSSTLHVLNYANVVAFVLNCVITFGATAIFSLPDNATLSMKYQTLVTPAPYAFAIWGIIFTAQFIWTIGQCFPSYRSSDLVVKGVGYNYVFACLAQCAWTFCFGFEYMDLSLLAMLSILLPLVRIVTTLSTIPAETIGQYWLLKFPFEIHAGWIMAATLVNLNVVFVSYTASSNVQTWVGGFSLLIVVCVGVFYTARTTQVVVPCVLIWASFAIGSELSKPRDQITATFSERTIHHTKVAAEIIGTVLSCAVVLELIHSRFFNKNKKRTEGSSTTSGNSDNGGSYSALN